MASQILQRFENTALPYIKNYCDMEKALEVLSGDEPNDWVHSPIHGERAKRAVGLAWLMKDENKAAALIKSKTAFLVKQKDFGLAGFQAFAESLPR